MALKSCTQCKYTSDTDATYCKNCGTELSTTSVGKPWYQSVWVVVGAIVVLIVIAIAIGSSGDDSPSSSGTANRTSASDLAKQREEAEDKRKGFHCLSSWDGNHSAFNELIKDEMHDPGSLKVYETGISPDEDGQHTIRVQFGGTNMFGAMVRQTAYGTVSNSTCEAELDFIE